MLLHLCRTMEASKDLLTQADKAIGDGDHGIGMARGFEAVRLKLEAAEGAGVGDLLKLAGLALITSVGGASGVIFGTLFRSGGANLAGAQAFGSPELALLLSGGLQGVKERGKAKVGDKTMVDALEPAALRAAELIGLPLDEALPQVAAAAEEGMESTKRLVATVGKAKTLGERSLGHADPGALSLCLLLRSMAEYTTGDDAQ